MQSFPYRFVGDSVKAEVRKALRTVLDTWSRAWFSSLPAYEIHIGSDVPVGFEWHARSVASDNWAAYCPKDRAQRDFMQLLFGPSAVASTSVLVAEVWHDCLSDLMARLVPVASSEARLLETESLSGLHTGAGSGALHIALEGALPIQGLALGGAWVETAAAEALPATSVKLALTPRHTLLSRGRARVELRLGEAELPLSELAGISVGDVLALDTPYKSPLLLRTTEGQALCQAHLGRIGQHKAIQIISK